MLLEPRRCQAHRIQHMAKSIAFRHARVRVAEHVLEEPCVGRDAGEAVP